MQEVFFYFFSLVFVFIVYFFFGFFLYFCLGVCFGSCIVPALLDLPSQLDEQGRFKLIRQQEEIEYEMRNEVRREGELGQGGLEMSGRKAQEVCVGWTWGFGGVY